MSARMKLGARVSDRLTGAHGVVIGRTVYLSSNPRLQIQPPTIKDGVPSEPFWIDEDRAEVMRDPKFSCGFTVEEMAKANEATDE